jgi:hypothetical protein
VNRKDQVTINLPAKYDYDATNNIKLPMVGNIANGKISFKNAAAILRVNVVNFPESQTKVTLTSKVGKLSGTATLGIKDASLTVNSTSGTTSIEIDKDGDNTSSYFTDKDYTFYFTIPEADYVTDDKDGLEFQIGEITYAKYAANLKAKKNHLYEVTLYYDATLSKFVLDNKIVTKLNNDLAKITDKTGGSATAKWTKDDTFKAGTIYVPSAATAEDRLDEVTINLEGLGAAELTLVPDPKGEYTPKKVIINSSVSETESSGQLKIQLPKSAVTLGKIGESVKLNKVAATTLPNILRVQSGVDAGTVTVTTSGNIYLEDDADATTSSACYVFTNKVTKVETSGSTTKAPWTIYDLLFPAAGTRAIALPSAFAVTTQPIEISDGVDLTLDLAGYELSTGADKNIITVSGSNAKLTIIDSGTDTKGSIATTSQSAAAIVVEEGGTVVVTKADITSSGDAVEVKSNGSFTLNGGTIVAGSDKDAVKLESGAATLNSDAIITASTKEYAVEGNITLTKGVAPGAKASSVEQTKGVVKGDVTVTESSFTLTAGTVNGKIKAGKSATVKMNGGAVNSIEDASGADANTAVTITNGVVGSASEATAITLANGGKVTVEGGTITASTTAVSANKGTLIVTGSGSPVLTAGTVISALPTNDNDATVTLEAEKAQYVSTNAYALINSTASSPTTTSFTAGSTKKAKLSIKKGNFTGDVISDAATYFITGGNFRNCALLAAWGTQQNWFQVNFGLGAGDTETGYAPVVGKAN